MIVIFLRRNWVGGLEVLRAVLGQDRRAGCEADEGKVRYGLFSWVLGFFALGFWHVAGVVPGLAFDVEGIVSRCGNNLLIDVKKNDAFVGWKHEDFLFLSIRPVGDSQQPINTTRLQSHLLPDRSD